MASVAVAPDPQAWVPPSFPGSIRPASHLLCLFAVCTLLRTSDFWIFAVSSSFSCALCVVLSRSGVSSTVVSLAWFEWGRSTLSASLFLFMSLLPGGILGFSFAYSHYPVFCCSCGFAGFCFSCPPLFAGHVRPTSASLSLLLGLPFHGPALVGSSSWALSESLSHAMWLLFLGFGVSPASGFAPSAAMLLRPALLVAVSSLRFFLCCWSACLAGGSSGLRHLAVCNVCCSSFLVCRAALLFSVVSAGLSGCGLRPLRPSHRPWSPALSPAFSSSRRRCWASASPLALIRGSGLALAPSALGPSCGGFHSWWSGHSCAS